MSELVKFLEARFADDERDARAAAAANPGAAATHWVAEQVDHRSSTGLRGTAWAVVPERVKGVAIAISPSGVRPLLVTHIARHDPARVLAEIEAKQRILRAHPLSRAEMKEPGKPAYGCATCHYHSEYGVLGSGECDTLRMLALPYAGHEGFKAEWRI